MYLVQSDIYSTKTEDRTMTNKEAKHQVFMEAHARWLANQEKHYGYNENVGKYQDDLNEMVWADWTFTEAHEKLWSDYIRYFEEGVSPYKAKLSKKEIERRLEKKMDDMVQAEFKRYAKATY